MKRKILTVLATVLLLSNGLSATVYATEAEVVRTVVFTNEDELEYIDGSTKLQDAFMGMAPGESRTVAIKIENQNSHTTSFYISGETTKALEEISDSAKGGAYEVQLSIGKDMKSAMALLDSIAGGYSGDSVASTEGLKEITELNGYQYLAELEENQYINIYLTIALDGEGMDSTNEVDYSNAVGSLAFQFQAQYDEDETHQIEEEPKGTEAEEKELNVVVKKVARTKIVKTGDTLAVGALLVVLAVGVTLVVVALKRGKAEKADE